LQPKTYELGIVTVKPQKKEKISINRIQGKKCYCYLVGHASPWMSARFFEYKPEYRKFKFIKEIKLIVNSRTDSSEFNIRIISANAAGEPEDNVADKNIIATAKKGNHLITIDLGDMNLKFPENGFFVAVEWLVIDQNKYEFYISGNGEKKKVKETRYGPGFGAFRNEGPSLTWTYYGGNWHHESFNDMLENNQYLDLAVELTLTN